MNSSGSRVLGRFPHLFAIYLVWMRRDGLIAWRMFLAAVLSSFLMASVTIAYLTENVARAVEILSWPGEHTTLSFLIVCSVAFAVVARQHSEQLKRVKRSWIAALPVERAANCLQSVILELWPIAIFVGLLAAWFVGLAIFSRLQEVRSPAATTFASLAGALSLGSVAGHWVPQAKIATRYEGSRYAPRWSRQDRRPARISLSPIRALPLRRLLASLPPRRVSRIVVPLMMMVPMDTAAIQALVLLALIVTVGSMLVLISSAISECIKASRWLRPLPIEPRQLVRTMFSPLLTMILYGSVIASLLVWALGISVVRCIVTGLIFWTVGVTIASLSARVLIAKSHE